MSLSIDEVEQLRRLHVLAQFGELPPPMRALFEELRAHDRSTEILAPTVDVQLIPPQRRPADDLDADDLDRLVFMAEALSL
jgi:hypothetical protein